MRSCSKAPWGEGDRGQPYTKPLMNVEPLRYILCLTPIQILSFLLSKNSWVENSWIYILSLLSSRAHLYCPGGKCVFLAMQCLSARVASVAPSLQTLGASVSASQHSIHSVMVGSAQSRSHGQFLFLFYTLSPWHRISYIKRDISVCWMVKVINNWTFYGKYYDLHLKDKKTEAERLNNWLEFT